MISKGTGAFILSFAAAGAAAQAPQQPPAPAVKAAMEDLGWLAGEWEGEGWRAGPDGIVETFTVRESVVPQLGGLVLIVEGRGFQETENGVRIDGHHAFGVFSYDAFTRRYHFDAFVKEGYQTRAMPIVGENEFSWSHPAGPQADMRFTARLTDDGDWLETGSYCEGETCRQTFEMRLTRME